MGQPIWQIKNSNLGTIAENVFFEFELEAIDTDLQPVSYSLIAGSLPDGIQLSSGSLSGVPIKVTGVPADVEEDTSSQFAIRATTTTNEVADITLDLTVSGQTVPELTTPTGSLGTFTYGDYVDVQLDAEDEDESNTLTWSVINNSLPNGLELIVDTDNDRIAYIRGYPVPATALPEGVDPGFDNQAFEEDLGEFGFDFGLNSVDKTFEFTISVTDGLGYDSGTYSLFLQSTLIFYTADMDTITVDALIPTADATVSDGKIAPIISTPAGDIGTYLHDNYFAFQIEAIDFEGDTLQYKEFLDPGEDSKLPGGLQIDINSGWLYGTLDTITTSSETYTFRVSAYKLLDVSFESVPVTLSMTIESDIANTLIISTPSTIFIDNGEISELSIEAAPGTSASFSLFGDTDKITADQAYPTVDFSASGSDLSILDETADTNTITSDSSARINDRSIITVPISLTYMLEPDSGDLPPGMALTSEGLLIGRPDFNQFDVDEGDTFFDDGLTNWDGIFTFGVRITDVTLGVIDQVETFTIYVNLINDQPFENLYLVAGPTIEGRAIYNNLISDTTIIPTASLYRPTDLYFGTSRDLRFLLADGLTVTSRQQYSELLEKNHYTRRLAFSDLKIAKAEDSDGVTKYEVIYADITDRLENNGESIAQEINPVGLDSADMAIRGVPEWEALYEITADDDILTADSGTLTADATLNPDAGVTVYPASIQNMRNVVLNGYPITVDTKDITADAFWPTADRTDTSADQDNLDTLPDWMTTVQDDGRILGWIPAVPIAYCLPGQASQVLFNMNESGFNLNEVSFDVDRYIWDRNLTDSTLNYFLTESDDETSFDGVSPNGSFVGGLSEIYDRTGFTADNRVFTADNGISASDELTIGVEYIIEVPGAGDWTTAGAADSNAGTFFTATATTNGASDGTAYQFGVGYITADADGISGLLISRTADNFSVTVDKLQPTVDVRNTTYTVGEIIIIGNAAITVDAIDALGNVSEFTILNTFTYADSNLFTIDLDGMTADADASVGIQSNTTYTQQGSDGTGTGFTLTPVRPADEPDVGDEYLKFPQTNILQ
jgi:hypothetical protein